MKIAVLSDIHGNIHALRSAHEAALALNPDMLIHLGDLGGYAPFVNEVVDYLIEHGINGVQGNYDYNIATGAEHCGCRYENPAQGELSEKAYQWTKKHTTEKSRQHMADLPATMDMDIEGVKLKRIFS